jgi:hypothetical protein
MLASLLKREYSLNMFDRPYNPLIEDYTEILYIISKWYVPSIQCKKRLGRCPLMGEVDRLSLVRISHPGGIPVI